jgi:transcriptional regulator with XRE-family HTH domain
MPNIRKRSPRLVELGNKIRLLRSIKGMTQMALSIKCNMEKASLSKIESGQVNISFLTLCRLGEGLGIEIKDFF